MIPRHDDRVTCAKLIENHSIFYTSLIAISFLPDRLQFPPSCQPTLAAYIGLVIAAIAVPILLLCCFFTCFCCIAICVYTGAK